MENKDKIEVEIDGKKYWSEYDEWKALRDFRSGGDYEKEMQRKAELAAFKGDRDLIMIALQNGTITAKEAFKLLSDE